MIGAGITWWERWVLRPFVWVTLVIPHEINRRCKEQDK